MLQDKIGWLPKFAEGFLQSCGQMGGDCMPVSSCFKVELSIFWHMDVCSSVAINVNLGSGDSSVVERRIRD